MVKGHSQGQIAHCGRSLTRIKDSWFLGQYPLTCLNKKESIWIELEHALTESWRQPTGWVQWNTIQFNENWKAVLFFQFVKCEMVMLNLWAFFFFLTSGSCVISVQSRLWFEMTGDLCSFLRPPHHLHWGPCAKELPEKETSQEKDRPPRKEGKGENLRELFWQVRCGECGWVQQQHPETSQWVPPGWLVPLSASLPWPWERHIWRS